MIKTIVKDKFILSRPCVDATKDDLYVVKDLKDTIKQYDKVCGGMAANMIGVCKNIIVYKNGKKYEEMINPVIIKQIGDTYVAYEQCLCYENWGGKETKRYQKIKVTYLDRYWKEHTKVFSGLTAQIIQHEIDHCHGILI